MRAGEGVGAAWGEGSGRGVSGGRGCAHPAQAPRALSGAKPGPESVRGCGGEGRGRGWGDG